MQSHKFVKTDTCVPHFPKIHLFLIKKSAIPRRESFKWALTSNECLPKTRYLKLTMPSVHQKVIHTLTNLQLLEMQVFESQIFNFQKKFFYLLQWKPFKNDEKYFLLHLKSSFRSQDIHKNGLIRNIKLISRFMTLQPG